MAEPQDEVLSTFCALTGCPPEDAEKYLIEANWDLNMATAEYFQAAEDDADDAAETAAVGQDPTLPPSTSAAGDNYTGPRTLDGRPAPRAQLSSSAAARTKKQPQKQKGLMTLNNLRGGGSGGSHDNDDGDDSDDDDEDDERGPRDLFAGGEKSGLAVQDPKMAATSNAKKVIRDIMAKSKARGEDTEAGPSQPAASRYRGTGQTLGGDGVPSRLIPGAGGASAGAGSGSETAGQALEDRALHIWQDGFSFDDGPLRRFDEPNNAYDLQLIRNGTVPLHAMNVQFGQSVNVKLHQHNENWHQLPRVYRPFAGPGHRLGSPVPGAPSADLAAAISATVPGPTSPAPAVGAAATPAAPAIDEAQPTLLIRVQLPDGTRLPARFNTTQTIGDVYTFVERALPTSTTRAWVLATTFPNKEHTDRDLVLGETAEFRRGGAAVVKWT